MKKHLSQQLWLFRFCVKASPKLFFFNIFAAVEQSAFVFWEYTIWIGYNLNAAENGAPFSHVALLTLGVFALYAVHQFIDSVYFQWSFDRLKPVLSFRLRRQIYGKAKDMDCGCGFLACFGNIPPFTLCSMPFIFPGFFSRPW